MHGVLLIVCSCILHVVKLTKLLELMMITFDSTDEIEPNLQDNVWNAISPYIRSINQYWHEYSLPFCSIVVLVVAYLLYNLLLPASVAKPPEPAASVNKPPPPPCKSWAFFPCSDD